MSVTFTQGRQAAEFLVSEHNGTLSRERGILASGNNLRAGHVVGRITASGLLREWNPGNSDGSQTVAGVLLANVNATAGNAPCAIVARFAEVNGAELQFFADITGPQRDAARAGLAALNIIER
jgi:hypothetical protein